LAVTSGFITQVDSQTKPDPAELTNTLLLRILEQLNGTNPPAPAWQVPATIARTHSVLFASESVTLLVASIAVLGKQWILRYGWVTTWDDGSVTDRGEKRQAKFMGLQRCGLHLIIESLLPGLLQLSLYMFGFAIAAYLWGSNISTEQVVIGVIVSGWCFCVVTTTFGTFWRDSPFQTVLSGLLPTALPWVKKVATLTGVRLRRWLRRQDITSSIGFLGRQLKIFACRTIPLAPPNEDIPNTDRPAKLSDPTLWRHDPLFTSPIPENIVASAGFWLVENSTDSSAVVAFAAVLPEVQLPSHHHSFTVLIRLRDVYLECFRVPEPEESTHLEALRSAAAYYVLYHAQLIWSTWKSLEVEVEGLPPDLPPDLFLQRHNDEWDKDNIFEYLLGVDVEDRSEPVKSARFLSYIAPYWFCGDTDSAIKSRPSRLPTLNELIEVLEESRALTPATITDCILCVGAAVDFPLHPEDLIRVDKRCVQFPSCVDGGTDLR
jgi:hypothetical protein